MRRRCLPLADPGGRTGPRCSDPTVERPYVFLGRDVGTHVCRYSGPVCDTLRVACRAAGTVRLRQLDSCFSWLPLLQCTLQDAESNLSMRAHTDRQVWRRRYRIQRAHPGRTLVKAVDLYRRPLPGCRGEQWCPPRTPRRRKCSAGRWCRFRTSPPTAAITMCPLGDGRGVLMGQDPPGAPRQPARRLRHMAAHADGKDDSCGPPRCRVPPML